jgi:hypothetical protein
MILVNLFWLALIFLGYYTGGLGGALVLALIGFFPSSIDDSPD